MAYAVFLTGCHRVISNEQRTCQVCFLFEIKELVVVGWTFVQHPASAQRPRVGLKPKLQGCAISRVGIHSNFRTLLTVPCRTEVRPT